MFQFKINKWKNLGLIFLKSVTQQRLWSFYYIQILNSDQLLVTFKVTNPNLLTIAFGFKANFLDRKKEVSLFSL